MQKLTFKRSTVINTLFISALVLVLFVSLTFFGYLPEVLQPSSAKNGTTGSAKSVSTNQAQQPPQIKPTRQKSPPGNENNTFESDATDVLEIRRTAPSYVPFTTDFDDAVLRDTVFRTAPPRAPPPLSV